MAAEQAQKLVNALKHLQKTASQHFISCPDSSALELHNATQTLQAVLGLIQIPKLSDINQDSADALWNGGCQLWDVCVQANNQGLCKPESPAATAVATLRQLTCQVLALLEDEQLTEEEHIYRLRFCLVAGRAWCLLQRWEQAELVLHLASAHAGVFQDLVGSTEVPEDKREEYITLLFDAHHQRLLVAWELGQQELASKLRATCCELADALQQLTSQQLHLHLQLAAALHTHGSTALTAELDDAVVQQILTELNEALRLVATVQAAVKGQRQEPAAAAGDTMKKAVDLHAKVLLNLAYCHLVHTAKVEDALRCIAALRQLDPATAAGGAGGTAAGPGHLAGAGSTLAGHPSVSLLALKAYVALQDLDHAEAEVTGLAVHDDADPNTCLAALLELVHANLPMERLQPIVELVQGRFPDDAQFLANLVTSLLSSKDATACADHEQMALQLLERCESTTAVLQEQSSLRQQVAGALHHAGISNFKAKQFPQAVKLLAAALQYAEDKAAICRVMAMCYMALQDMTRTLEYADLTEKYLPLQAATSFIRLKAHLLRQDHAACSAEVQHLCRCKDFDPELLKIAVQESMAAGALATAKAALLRLHALLVEAADKSSSDDAADSGAEVNGTSASTAAATPEARVLRALVKLVGDELQDLLPSSTATPQGMPDPCAAKMAAASPAVEHAELLIELGRLLTTVISRLRALGAMKFTGCSTEQEAQQELAYFATLAFNAGLTAAEVQDYQACAVLMNHCGQLLYTHSTAHTPEMLQQAHMAFLLASSAALEVHKKMPEHTGSLGLSKKMLAASDGPKAELEALQPGVRSAARARMHIYRCLLDMVLALRSKDPTAKAAALAQLRAARGCTAEHLMKVCMACQERDTRDTELAAQAARLALEVLVSSSSPDVVQVAHTLRLALTLISKNEDKLHLVVELAQVLLGFTSGAYPAQEAAWLVAFCWNSGLQHQRFNRHQLASQFMCVALDLLPMCPTFQDKQPAMAEECKRQQALAAAAAPQGQATI